MKLTGNLKKQVEKEDTDDPEDTPVFDDYNLVAYSRFRVDYEYIVGLLQGFVDSLVPDEVDETEFEEKIKALREVVSDFAGDNPKLGALLSQVIDEIEADWEKFRGQDMSVIINRMRFTAVNKEVDEFAAKWFLEPRLLKYEVYNYRKGEIANENKLKDSIDYSAYKESTDDPVTKFKYRTMMIDEFKNVLMPEISPLLN